MKKFQGISVLAVLATISMVLIINSCTKQEYNDQPVTENQVVKMSDEDIVIYNNILNFKEKIEYFKKNPNLKSIESMSVDSVIWYLGANLNFTHAFAFQQFEDYYTDSVFITIPIEGGEVNLTDLSIAYYSMVEKVKNDIYMEVPGNDKQLYNAYTTVSTQQKGELIVKGTVTIGSKHEPPGSENPIYDDWAYGEMDGKCTDPWINSDAIHEIASATLSYRHYYIQDEGDNWHAYYTGPSKVATVESHVDYIIPGGINILLNPEDETPNDNYLDRLMFYQNVTNDPLDECIFREDGNFYYHGTHEVIYEIIPDNANYISGWNGVQGKTFNGINGIEGYYLGTELNKTKLYHKLDILYQTRHIICDDEYPIPID